MSCPRTAGIRRRLLSGDELGPDDARHLATCALCQRAAAEVDRLDGRLREAVRPLAAEPLTDEILVVESVEAERRMPVAFGLGSVAMGVVIVAIAIAAVTQLRPPTAVEPSLTPSATIAPSIEPASTPSTRPSATPAPSVTPAPPASETSAWLVAPLDRCADGSAGFAVFLPEGWYANRHAHDQPACRTIGHVREVEGNQILDPILFLGVVDTEPTYDVASPEDQRTVSSASGIVMTRTSVRTPETGAVAAAQSVEYAVQLSDGRWLTASADATDDEAVDALDAVMERLELFPRIAIGSAAADEAEGLFTDRDVCQDAERGLAVVFPDAWWTNTAVDDLPACSWFAPTSFEVGAAADVPAAVELTVSQFPGDYGTFHEIVGWDSVTVLDRPATRWIIDDGDSRTYQYVIQLGPIAEFGPTLVAGTTAAAADLDLAMAVLDGIVARMTFADPPPGATSGEAPITAPAVSAATEGDGFRLELVVEQDRYRAGQPILADATLTWLGPEATVTVWGSSMGPVFTGIRQLDGPIDPGFAVTSDCVPQEISADAPRHRAFGKSGSIDGEDPLASWYEAYFRDPLLRVPPGRWEITASAAGTVGGDDCGEGPQLLLTVRVEIVVEP